MLVDFSILPEESRVWIYQANRSFSEDELQEIQSKLDIFIENWTAHGSDLQAGYTTKYKRFIVIGLNQNLNAASGCSATAAGKTPPPPPAPATPAAARKASRFFAGPAPTPAPPPPVFVVPAVPFAPGP